MATSPNENVNSVVKDYISKVYKYYANPRFREEIVASFPRLDEQIYHKCDKRASQHRNTGNDYFKNQQFEDALREYDEAVLLAEWHTIEDNQDPEIAVALSNRSMALLKLKRFKECLEDARHASSFSLSESLKKKLAYRIKQATDNHSDCLQNGHSLLFNPENNHPIDLKNELKVGDLFLVETAEVSVLKPEYQWTRCFNCLRFLAMDWRVPCRGCCQVRYCSFDCSKESWRRGHKHFCLYLNLFKYPKGKDAFSTSLLLPCLHLLSQNLTLIYTSLRKGELPQILGSNIQEAEDTEEWDMAAQASAHLLTFFTTVRQISPENENVPKKYDFELLGALLMAYFRVFEARTRLIKALQLATQLDELEVPTLQEKVVGYGIFPELNRILHSCNPNTAISQFYGRKVIVRAIENIPQEAERTLDLGVSWTDSTLDERQSYLRSKFNLNCECSACLDQIQPISKAFVCPKCKGNVWPDGQANCSKCNENPFQMEEVDCEISACQQNVKQANLFLIRREPDVIKAEDYLLDVFRRYEAILHPLNENFIEVCSKLSYCYKLMRNFRKAVIHAQRVYDCSEAKHNRINFVDLNSVLLLLDRQVLFLVHGKAKAAENREIYEKVLRSIAEKIYKVKFLLDSFHLEEDKLGKYFQLLQGKLKEKGFAHLVSKLSV